MLVRAHLAMVVDDPDVATAVVVLPAGLLAAAVVPLVIHDEAVLVLVPDAVPAHGPSARRLLVVESSACGHGRHLDPSRRSDRARPHAEREGVSLRGLQINAPHWGNATNSTYEAVGSVYD